MCTKLVQNSELHNDFEKVNAAKRLHATDDGKDLMKLYRSDDPTSSAHKNRLFSSSIIHDYWNYQFCIGALMTINLQFPAVFYGTILYL